MRPPRSPSCRACCRRRCSAIGAAAACSTAAIRFSVTLPLGRELWGEADVVLARRHAAVHPASRQWGIDDDLTIIRVDADPEEPERFRKPAVALIGDAAPILRRLLDALPAHNRKRASRRAEMEERQAAVAQAPGQARAADRLSRGDPRRAARGRHLRRRGDADRLRRAAAVSGLSSRARFCRPAIRTISAGALPPRSARRMRAATCRCCRSPATAASCSPRTNWPPPCATAFR